MNLKSKIVRAGVACGAGLLLAGCNTGKDSIVFVTKTSYGVDIDRSPPTIDIAFGRKEGMLGPVYTNGANLPVLASFHGSGGVLHSSIGQSFATGHSAELIARYLGTSATLQDSNAIPMSEIKGKATVGVGSGGPKRHLFGTTTSFGLKVQFAEETAYIPDSINIGYKRKEVAWVPLRVEGEGANRQVSLPSLVATHGNAINTGGFTNAGSSINQFFATGTAADYLMARSVIRDTIGFRVIGDAELATKMRGEESNFNDQTALVGNVQRTFAAANPAKQDQIRARAISLGLVRGDTTNADFAGRLSDAVDRSNKQRSHNLQALDAFANSLP